MARIRIPQRELEALLLGELRAKPGCAGALVVKISVLPGAADGANWNVSALDSGAGEGVTCATTLEQIARQLRRKYDAIPDAGACCLVGTTFAQP